MAFCANHVASGGNQKVRAHELLSNFETVHYVTMAFLSIETCAVQSTGASRFSVAPSHKNKVSSAARHTSSTDSSNLSHDNLVDINEIRKQTRLC